MSEYSLVMKDDLSIQNCRGTFFRTTFQKIYTIIAVQFSKPHVKGIKGFVFHGEAGVGKTLMAEVLAHELCVPLLFVDSSTIARSKYGESEEQIMKVFREAERRPSIILFDDAESLFPDRRAASGESWNRDENNTIFHRLDNIDTSRCCVILTTNILELLDKALLDRLYPIDFPAPDLDTALAIARQKCKSFGIKSEQTEQRIRGNPEELRSIRAIEKLVAEQYVNGLELTAMESGTRLGHPFFS
jgi:SpoVK/Ycf46/Vps4 family AAA+-type ATPase